MELSGNDGKDAVCGASGNGGENAVCSQAGGPGAAFLAEDVVEAAHRELDKA